MGKGIGREGGEKKEIEGRKETLHVPYIYVGLGQDCHFISLPELFTIALRMHGDFMGKLRDSYFFFFFHSTKARYAIPDFGKSLYDKSKPFQSLRGKEIVRGNAVNLVCGNKRK